MDKKVLVFTAMGFECVALVGGFVFLGRYLDEKFGWGDLGTAMGALIGTVAWIFHLILLFKQVNQPTDSDSGAN